MPKPPPKWRYELATDKASATKAEEQEGEWRRVTPPTLAFISIQGVECPGVEPLHRTSTTYRRVYLKSQDVWVLEDGAIGA